MSDIVKKINGVKLKCQYCGKEIIRTIVVKKATCYDCKMKRNRKNANKSAKKRDKLKKHEHKR